MSDLYYPLHNSPQERALQRAQPASPPALALAPFPGAAGTARDPSANQPKTKQGEQSSE